jgi:hypothetical protein
VSRGAAAADVGCRPELAFYTTGAGRPVTHPGGQADDVPALSPLLVPRSAPPRRTRPRGPVHPSSPKRSCPRLEELHPYDTARARLSPSRLPPPWGCWPASRPASPRRPPRPCGRKRPHSRKARRATRRPIATPWTATCTTNECTGEDVRLTGTIRGVWHVSPNGNGSYRLVSIADARTGWSRSCGDRVTSADLTSR